jgi:biopolymer transport protein ExbB
MKKILLVLLVASISLFGATESELERAYAKEFAYLKAQKKMLTKRLKEVKSSESKNISTAKRDLSVLQNMVLRKNALSEKLEDELFRTHQNAQVVSDDTSLLENVAMQAAATLKPFGVEVEVNPKAYQSSLETIFIQADLLIKKLSSVRVEMGQFYVNDGSEINAQIVKIGNIASYAVSDTASGALVPAGAGKFKLWNAPESAVDAQALIQGSDLENVHVFIYENANKEIADSVEKNVIDVINSGGIIGWVIMALGAVALLLVILRVFFLLGASKSTDVLAKQALAKLLKGGKDEALAFMKAKKGSTARVIKATIRNLDRDREHIEDIVSEAILHESGRLDRFGSVILVVAAVAPLLGLLGTVTGMIATFDIITEFGTGDPKLLSGGISIALVTTELGLIVAIPVLMLGNLLSGWAERIKDSMEHSALHIINEYNKQY